MMKTMSEKIVHSAIRHSDWLAGAALVGLAAFTLYILQLQ